MKPRPSHYARAFIDSMQAGASYETAKTGLTQSLAKNGDAHRLSQVVHEIEKIETKAQGGRMIEIEFAREPEAANEKKLFSQFKKEDRVAARISPALIAGTRITLDEALELDLSLTGKMRAMFNH